MCCYYIIRFYVVPDNIGDETIGSIQFSENFVHRYGDCHPMFYQGTLDDAVKEACQRPAKSVNILNEYNPNTICTMTKTIFIS